MPSKRDIIPILRVPGVGRILVSRDPGDATTTLMFMTNLTATVIRKGEVVKVRDLGSGLVTTAGVVYLAADFAGGGSDISAMNWHASGIGIVAAAIGDTALGNTTGAPARIAGTQSTPGNTNIYRTVATTTYASSLSITEWGLFSAVTGGTMWDRKVFTAIPVVSTDSIQWTYSCTLQSGG